MAKQEFFRCLDDGKLVTVAMIKRGLHVGHQIKSPTSPTVWEHLLLWLKLIK